MTRVQRWERRTEIPLLLLALAFLVAYAWPIINPSLDHDIDTMLDVVGWSVWVAFAFDLVIRVALADDRRGYLLKHWYDLILVAVPMFRPLRMLRVLAFARVFGRSATRNLADRVATYVVGTAIASIGLGALAVLDVERRSPEANITNLGDALWWAVCTVTTVGYGDFYPVTTGGRLLAVVLMIIGIAVLGSVTAAVASWFVDRVQQEAARAKSAEADSTTP